MLFPIKCFDEVVKEMKSFGLFLMPYSAPKVSPEDDDAVKFLKGKEVIVDGYTVVIYYSKNDWPTHQMEVLQITAKYAPFLPFSLVCKIGKKFLGDKHLSYVDFLKDDRKTYCWTVASDKTNNPIPAPYKKESLSDDCVYEGLCYKCLNPSQTSDKKV
jgi:hypothetical protein